MRAWTPGEKRAKLSLVDAIEIRVRVRHGERRSDLAREKGVVRGTIHAIVHRRTHRLKLPNRAQILVARRRKERSQ